MIEFSLFRTWIYRRGGKRVRNEVGEEREMEERSGREKLEREKAGGGELK